MHLRDKIVRRIRELQAELQTIEAKATERAIDKLAVTKESILAELARIGFANMLDYVQPNAAGGFAVNLPALSRDQAAAIQEVIVDYETRGGDDKTDVKRVRLKLPTSAPRWSISASIWDCSSSGGTSPRNTATNRPMNSPPASAPSSIASKASASMSEAPHIVAELQRRKRTKRVGRVSRPVRRSSKSEGGRRNPLC